MECRQPSRRARITRQVREHVYGKLAHWPARKDPDLERRIVPKRPRALQRERLESATLPPQPRARKEDAHGPLGQNRR